MIPFKLIEHLRRLIGNGVDHRSIAPGFERQPGYVGSVFHLSLRPVTFADRSAVRQVAVRQQYLHFTWMTIGVLRPLLCT